MINFSVDDARRILILKAEGLITEADLDAAIEALQTRYPAVGVHVLGGERGGFNALLDWEKLDGWEKGAKLVGTMTAKVIGDAARKIAVVADDKWLDEQPRLQDAAKNALVRFFQPSQRVQALVWLSGE